MQQQSNLRAELALAQLHSGQHRLYLFYDQTELQIVSAANREN